MWVYSPRVEAIHLRGGKVARGGIRWSDRQEDFRTEILGLIKAQMVKNSVIVPLVPKGLCGETPTERRGREAYVSEGIECYKTFMRARLMSPTTFPGMMSSLLDVVRHDEDDPYLVVAADKGTATFSDIANSISVEYGYLTMRSLRAARKDMTTKSWHYSAWSLGGRQTSLPGGKS